MIYCQKCGNGLDDDAVFCPKCGAKVYRANSEVNGTSEGIADDSGIDRFKQTMSCTFNEGYQGMHNAFNRMQGQYSPSPAYTRDEDVFVDPDERLISRLGGGWFVNLAVLGRFKSLNAILTDKRCYLQGNMYSADNKQLTQFKSEKIVNVEDINSTGFIYRRTLSYFIAGIICAILFLPCFMIAIASSNSLGSSIGIIGFPIMCILTPLFFVLYYLSKKTYFYIEYPGGGINFEVRVMDYEQVKLFGKEIHRVKDYSRAAIRQEISGKDNL